ncbi:MAG: hypothetical protein QM784_30325 [Polyangiaceae bacterium]
MTPAAPAGSSQVKRVRGATETGPKSTDVQADPPSWEAATTPDCSGPGNVMMLVGERGEYVTQGRTVRLAGEVSGRVLNGGHGVSLMALGESGQVLDRSELTLSVPRSAPAIHPGEYRSTSQRNSSADTTVSVSYSSQSCNGTLGTIEVQDVKWTGTQLTRFVATFEQRCGNAQAALRGCIRFDGPANVTPEAAPAPPPRKGKKQITLEL